MICRNCNTNNEEGTKFCKTCGTNLEGSQIVNQTNVNTNYANTNYTNNTAAVPEYKMASAIIAIVVSILCCGGIFGVIFAILSLVEGSNVKKFVQQGDIQSANASLEKAKKWNKISWIAIAVVAALVFIYCLFVFGSVILSNM